MRFWIVELLEVKKLFKVELMGSLCIFIALFLKTSDIANVPNSGIFN
jgi:hypothetical protein